MLKFVGTALTAAALIVGAAHAEDVIRKDVEVSYHDLNLSTEAGARQLLVRINAAATTACGSSPSFYATYSIAPSLAYKQFDTCRGNAINAAVSSIKAPLVHQLFASNGSYDRVAGAR